MRLMAVIFDMDGVLTDTVESHFRSWQQVCAQYCVPFTRRDNEKLLGLTRRASLEAILDGRSFPEEQIQEMLRLKNRYFLELIEGMTPRNLLPGVEELLVELGAAGTRIGVASASRNVRVVLRKLGIAHYMQALNDGTSPARSKPAPDAFLSTAHALKVEPTACLAIEDSRAGVQAALLAGMCAVGIGPQDRVGQAQKVFPCLLGVHLADLERIYEKWRAAQAARRLGVYEWWVRSEQPRE
jgi:kojibiose phosphorylase